MEQMTQLTAMCEMIPACCDDDDDDVDYTIAITPVLSTEEPIDSLSMGDEHLDIISETESDEVIKSSVEDLVPIPSEFEGIPDTMCDVHLVNNSTPLEAKDHFEILIQKKQEEKQIQEDQAATAQNRKIPTYYDDDDDDSAITPILSTEEPEDYTFAITPNEPILSTEEPDNSLSMGDEHLDTIPVTESDELIKSSVENLIPIPSESEEFSLIDDDSFSIDNIDYVEVSPLDSELVSSEVMEIVIPEVGGIDDDILLTIKDDILCEKLLNVNLLIAKIEALNATPTPSSDCKTKSGSPTTHSDSPFYASFIFDLLINPFPPADKSDFYEFTDELIPFISPPEYDCFLFKVEPNSRDFTKDAVEDISLTKKPQVLNDLPTHPTLQLNMKFQPSSESLFTYVVWIFLPFL
nr:hypothetical protein [Tanacetum cinerariifolium]